MQPTLLISPSTTGWRVGRRAPNGPELGQVDSLESLPPGEPILAVPSRDCLPALLENTGAADSEELTYLLEERLPLPAEDFVADFSPAAPDLFAVAAPRRPLAALIESLESHGQIIHHACPLSLLALQHLLPSLDHPDAVLLQDGDATELILLADDRPTAWHIFTPANSSTLPVYLRAAALRRTAPLRLTAIGADESLLNQLRSVDEIDVTRLAENESIHAHATRAARAIAEGRLTPWIDLRRGSLAPSDPNRPIRRALNALVLATVLCTVCVIAAMLSRARHYAGLEADARRAQEELFRATLPGRPLPPDVKMRLASEEARLNSSTAAPTDDAPPGETGPAPSIVPSFYTLLSQIPSDTRFRLSQVRLGDRQLSLEGEADSHGAADALAVALRTHNAFQIAAPRTELTRTGVLFTINGTIPAAPVPSAEARR
jgi:hypothetical protein